jgi:hypothetical protein
MSSHRKTGANVVGAASDGDHTSTCAETPYTIEEFAEKYGLSRKAADVVLLANGPSRQKSDAGARAFLAAVAAFCRR